MAAKPPTTEPFRIKYNPGPVTMEFMKDRENRALLLIGPVGCLSADTEYLTPTGWKRFDEYTEGDQVAEFDCDTQQLIFRQPAYVRYGCSLFLRFRSTDGRIDQLLSVEHTVLYRDPQGEWQTDTAMNVSQRLFTDDLTGYQLPIAISTDPLQLGFIDLQQVWRPTAVPSEDGFKYCFETKAGFFPARRNGKIFITGNTGKTTAAAYKLLMLNSRWIKPDKNGKRRSRYAVIRNTYGDLKDATIRTYLDWFPPAEFGGGYHQTDKNATYRIADREIEICFRALDDESDVRKLLSTEYSGGHIDEAKEIPRIVMTGLMSRFRYPARKDYENEEDPFTTRPQILLTTNYPNRDHWLHRDFVAAPKIGYRIFEQTQEENKHNLPDNYYENQMIDFADRPDMLKTLVLGQWGMTYKGKLVYPEWATWPGKTFLSPTPIIPDSGKLIHRGWDNTGLHPACVITQMNSQNQWTILREFWHEDIGITEFTEWVHLWCQDNLNGARFTNELDPACKNRGNDPTKGSSLDWMKKYFNGVGAPFDYTFGVQTPVVRREAVVSRIGMTNGRPLMLIDPSCRLVIDGFDGGYHRKEIGNSGIYKAEPFKDKYADCFAAGTQVATLFGSRPIESLRVGDYVDTPLGYRRVTATMNRPAATVEVITTQGSVRCTPTHRFAGIAQFTCADELQYSNILIGINTKESAIWADEGRNRTKISMDSGFISTKNSRITTIMSEVRRTFESVCTALSMNFFTVQFQGAGASITKITTEPITELKTWKSTLSGSMRRTTPKNNTSNHQRKQVRELSPPEKLQKHGTLHQRVMRGIKSTVRIAGKTKSKRLVFARGAKLSTKRTSRLSKLGIVQTNVFTMPGLRQVLTTLTACALNAARHFAPTSTQDVRHAPRFVRLQKPIESELVYDVTVEDAHVFYANGILVSNCHDGLAYTATVLFAGKDKKEKPVKSVSTIMAESAIRGDF